MKFSNEKETDKIHQFLMGLNDETFSTVRSQILGTEPLPTLHKVYPLVVQEEWQKIVARGRDAREETMTVAFAAVTVGQGMVKPTQYNKPQCDHCRKTGHEKSWCWELIGYPENWEPGGPKSAAARRKSSSKGRGAVRMTRQSSTRSKHSLLTWH